MFLLYEYTYIRDESFGVGELLCQGCNIIKPAPISKAIWNRPSLRLVESISTRFLYYFRQFY